MNDVDAIAQLLRETTIHARDVAKRLGVTVDAVVRWMRLGRMAGGRRVRLLGVKAGRGWQTSEEELARFLAACSPTAQPGRDLHGLAHFETRRAQAARARFAKVMRGLGRRKATG